MRKYRKLPVVIDAEQWRVKGDVPEAPLSDYLHESEVSIPCGYCGRCLTMHAKCETLEGHHIVCPGDYIIKGIQGEFYPCKPDIFEATYEPVDSVRGYCDQKNN